MKRFLPIFFTLATVSAIIGYRIASSDIGERFLSWFGAENEIPVQAVQVRRGSLTAEVHGSGELRPVKEADVVASIPGILQEVKCKVGDAVAAGQVIASLRATELIQRSRETEAALRAAQGDLRENEAHLSEQQKKLEQTRELSDRDLIARQELSAVESAAATARAQTELARARLAQQQASLEQLRYLLSFSQVLAPFAGVVTRRLSEPGAYLQRSEPIITLGTLDLMQVIIKIPEKDLSLIHRGMPAQIKVEAFPGRIFEGNVSVLHSGSQTTGSSTIAEIHVANRDRLLATGMGASVALLAGEKREALLVPRQAVMEIAGKNYGDVVVKGRVQQRPITVGWNQEGMVEIISGAREGDWIIVGSPAPLTDNTRVRIAAEKKNPGR